MPDLDLITKGSVVRWKPTGAIGVVEKAGSRSSKVKFVMNSALAWITGAGGKPVVRVVKNSQLTRKAARK